MRSKKSTRATPRRRPAMAAGMIGAAAVAVTAGVAQAAVAPYTLDTLGIPDTGDPSGGGSGAYGINNSGVTAGYLDGSNSYAHAFVGTSGALTVLPSLGGRGWYATAINDAGQVAGSSRIAGADPLAATPYHATV